MNDIEAAQVFAVLRAAWPDKDIPAETIELWMELAEQVDVRDAQPAALQIVREDQWWPTIARFLEVCRVHERRRLGHEAQRRGLGRPGGVEPPAGLVAAARRVLADREGLPSHWHGGPGPCRVCGGVRPPSSTLERKAS